MSTDVVEPSAEAPGTRGRSRFGTASLGVPPPTLDPVPDEPDRRRRRWPWVVGGIVLAVALLAGAFLGGRAVGGRGQVEVWQLRTDLPAGAAVEAGDVVAVRVSDRAGRAALGTDMPPNGRITTSSLRAGQLLPPDLLPGGTPLPGTGQVLLGIATLPGAVPDGLHAGDAVAVVKLPVTTSSNGAQPDLDAPGQIILPSVRVHSVTAAGQGTAVSIVVPALATNALTALSAQNRIALVARPPGPS